MKTKASFRYILNSNKKAVKLYYTAIIVVFALFVIMSVVVFFNSNTSDVKVYFNFRMFTAVFLFFMGLLMFKANFGMLLQNGVTRKQIFKSSLMAMSVFCTALSAVDTVILFLFDFMGKSFFGVLAEFNLTYLSATQNANAPQVGYEMHIIEFVLFLVIGFFAIALGYFVSVLWYWLDKSGKGLFIAGVFVLLYLLKSINRTFYNNQIFKYIFTDGVVFVIFAGVTIALLLGAALIIKKANLKAK